MKVKRLTRQLCPSVALFAALILTGCGSTPASKQVVAPTASPVITEKTTQDAQPNADELLELARETWRTQRNIEPFLSALDNAIHQLIAEQRLIDAKHALKTRLALTSTDSSDQAALRVMLHNLFKHDSQVSAEQLLALTQPTSSDHKVAYEQQQQRAALYQRYGLNLAAANELTAGSQISAELVYAVWLDILDMLPQQVLKSRARYPNLAPFFDLYDLLTKYAPGSTQLIEAIAQFRRVYRGSAIDTHWPLRGQTQLANDHSVNAVIQQASPTELHTEQRVSVLLPLNGRLKDVAEDVKAGLLAAYYTRLETFSAAQLPVIEFHDSEALDDATLGDIIRDTNYIIGPLQKEYVAKVQALLQPHQFMLALNRIDEVGLRDTAATSNLAYFSLSPEDEATQLAEILFDKQLHKPIIVTSEQAPYPRMQAAFTARWQELHELTDTQEHLDIVTFTDNDSLREGITQALDVAQSKGRIQQIKVMVNEELYNVPRSRQDIDAVVVLAGIQETELLNPIIEASLSPFGNAKLPVYASSKSIEYDNTQNQWRDLQAVRFIDIPFLLPDNAWHNYQEQSNLLWPEPQPQQQRLFAFGVDAFNLLAELPDLLASRARSTQGLTGTLSINRFGEFRRWLPNAVIQPTRIERVTD